MLKIVDLGTVRYGTIIRKIKLKLLKNDTHLDDYWANTYVVKTTKVAINR